MKRQFLAAVAAVFVSATLQAEVVIETVPVGNPGNAIDHYGFHSGGVDYVYRMGKFEVTAGQYTEFLNAVAATDTYGLYNPKMNDTEGCQITQNGTSGNFTYDFSGRPSGTEADWADRPVNLVSWGDATRFCNWLHNGQPTGGQDLTTTEDGSYYLNGATTTDEIMAVVREPDATWVLPTEDEWHKAAYHKNDGVTGNYFEYATSRDGVPGYVNDLYNLSGTGTTFTEGGTDPGNYATYDGDEGIHGIGPPYYRTKVGEWENSESPYGTFDQCGNVHEWNERNWHDTHRGIIGGSFRSDHGFSSSTRGYIYPLNGDRWYGLGYRVADTTSECGNGIVEFGEECDDADADDNDYCFSTCERNWDVPTVSEWGLVTLALLGLTAGTFVFGNRKCGLA